MSHDYARVAVDDWKKREWKALAKIHDLEMALKRDHGGVYDGYAAGPEFKERAERANRLRLELEKQWVLVRALRQQREPTREELTRALKRLPAFKDIAHGAGSLYDYNRKLDDLVGKLAGSGWAWKPVPAPGGKPGEILHYETPNGRAELRRSKGKEWSLFLDGKEHPLHSKKPGFGHAETVLQRELGRDYDRRASSR